MTENHSTFPTVWELEVQALVDYLADGGLSTPIQKVFREEQIDAEVRSILLEREFDDNWLLEQPMTQNDWDIINTWWGFGV